MASRRASRRKKKTETQPDLSPDALAEKSGAQTVVDENTASTKTTRPTQGKRKDIGSLRECPNLKIARFRTERDEEPVESLEFSAMFRGPAPFRIGYDDTVFPPLPQELIRYDGATRGASLTNDAIADLLRETQPNCPKTQAWIRAYEASKTARGCEARIADRDHLRRQMLARRLRDQTGQTVVSGLEISATLTQFPIKSGDEQDVLMKANVPLKEEMGRMQEQMERVSVAHERLQKTMEECRTTLEECRVTK